ncbi:MAG: hypothetical protein JNM24_00840 [Bdellovibrionaceae bacterium]|nr:hypothetical protein [Pseudobdellovibrionaceae bacterium]
MSRSTVLFITLIFISVAPTVSFALDFSEEGIYRATKDACRKVRSSDLSNLNADKLRAGYFPSVEYTEVLNFIRHESVKQTALQMNFSENKAVTYIIGLQSFHKALTECYPNDPKLRTFFIRSVYSADRAGKIVGIAAIATIFKGVGRLSTLVQNWSATASNMLGHLDKAFIAFVSSAVLTGDTSQSDSRKVKLDTQEIQRRLSIERQNLELQLESLRKQIYEQEEKLRFCDNCPEKNRITVNRDGLLKILEISQQPK